MRFLKSLLASALLVTLVGGCTEVPDDSETFEPKGVMMGTVTYMGPLPCSENGHVVGNAVLTLFNVNALPPPAGLGLSAHRIAVVPGDVLFAGVAHMIPTDDTGKGKRTCPNPGTMVQVSASWEVGPVDPGAYQVRGWFDLDGDWHAAFKFANMITKGDIGGGAIANITEALAGGPVKYSVIDVGIRQEDDSYRIPESGYVARNVSPILAAPTANNRPYFHISQMRKGRDESGIPDPIENPSDEQIAMPADYRLYNANTFSVHDSLYWLRFQAGLPDAERGWATAAPFLFKLDDPPSIVVQRYDANKDGVIDALDHITGTTLPVVALGPIISLTKLDVVNDTKKLWRSTQNKPRVLTSLVVTSSTMTSLVDLLSNTEYDDPVAEPYLTAYIRPSGVCVEDATDPFSKTVIVTPHEKDLQDPAQDVIGDEDATKKDIAEQLSRDISGVVLQYGCLPPGKFALNAIYPTTGQAWTLPNESGICMPGEEAGDGTCGDRAKLASQFRTLDIAPASDPAYCNSRRAALSEADAIRDYCLTPAEREAYINGTLWGGDPNPL